MSSKANPSRLLLLSIFLFSLLTDGFAEDQETGALLASTGAVHAVIHDAYMDVLHREPDEAGLQTYTRYMLHEGKDSAWLRKVLRDSKEGQRLRARDRVRITVIQVTLSMVVGAMVLILAFRRRLRCLFTFFWEKLSFQHQQYLAEAASLSPVAAVLALLYFYTYFKAGSPLGWLLCGLVITVVLIAVKVPRWTCYMAVICGIMVFISWNVFVDANGKQDAGSDRDDAVEIAARAVLDGKNPWSHKSILGLPITTGPSSILMALPFVGLLGKINALTFIMWSAFVAILALADIRQRNNTFLTACLLLFFPWFGFLHTLHWSLDELYYAALLSPLLWLALSRERFVLAGLVGGGMAFARLSYAPAVIAAGLWWILKRRRHLRSLLYIALAGIIFAVAVSGFFWLVGGDELLQRNFWKNSQMAALHDRSNLVASLLTSVLGALPKGTLGSIMLVLALTVLAALAMRHLEHPFYHMAVASILSHTIAFSPGHPMDYQLIFLIPALYGLSLSSRGSIGGDGARNAGSGEAPTRFSPSGKSQLATTKEAPSDQMPEEGETHGRIHQV